VVKMFKSMEESGFRGFLGVSGSVFVGALTEFFANTAVIGGTIVSTVANRKMVITKDVFEEMFPLPTDGLVSFTDLPAKAVAEMKMFLSATGVSFRPPNKKKDMKVECRLLHDIVAKSLSAKAGSFYVVMTKKFEMMVAISAELKVNWGHILFQTLVSMVYIPGKKSHVVLIYMKKNQAAPQAGEARKLSGDTASENKLLTDGLQSLTNKIVKEKVVVKKEKVVVTKRIVAGSQAGPAKSKSETGSDED
ncbi:hypothetical protein F511_24613, partial [Dorcoceras hygrometricum]